MRIFAHMKRNLTITPGNDAIDVLEKIRDKNRKYNLSARVRELIFDDAKKMKVK